MKWKTTLVSLATVAALTGAAAPVYADVKLDGTWPAEPRKVSVSITGATRSEALRALAKEANWSLILNDETVEGNRVTLQLVDAEPKDVLSALLADGSWIAVRKGDLVTISRAPSSSTAPVPPPAPPPVVAAAPPVPPVPPSPPSDVEAPAKRRNISVLANTVHIGKEEVVADVNVLGGSVEIEGRVTGSLSVYNGKAILRGARIDGDVNMMSGSMSIEPGTEIGGDLDVVGGAIEGSENAKVGGDINLDPSEGNARASFTTRAMLSVSSGLRGAAFLFIVGVVFIALGGNRADELRASIAERPMKSIALGLVGILGTIVAVIACAITLIGIPVAVLGVIAALLLGLAGTTACLAVLGGMLAGHKSKNVYVHLAVGCATFMVMGFLPWIGGFLQTLVVFGGIGGMVSTRALGLLKRKPKPVDGPHPYR